MTSPALRQKHFARRAAAAEQGVHLPTEEELLRGMGFFGKDLVTDAREYAERLARRIRKTSSSGATGLLQSLDELAVGVTAKGVADILSEAQKTGESKAFSIDDLRLRCEIYLAWLGDPQSAATMAAEMGRLAFHDARSEEKSGRQKFRALAWCVQAARLRTMQVDFLFAFSGPGDLPADIGSYIRAFVKAEERLVEREVGIAVEAHTRPPPETRDESIGEIKLPLPEVERDPLRVVVISGIGNATTTPGKQVVKEYQDISDVHLPLTPVPYDLSPARKELVGEFPYAAETVDAVLETLVGRAGVQFSPTVFIGSPGNGKTRFARRLSEVLRVPYEIVQCGGIADSSPGGTPRQWSTGQPSLPLMVVRQSHHAGPVVILDEIEKTGDSRHNGRFHDVLLGLLERESASRWMDPYVMAACDLSHVSWLMTANTPDPIPQPLRDRIRFVRFPDPRAEDLPVLAARMLEDHCATLGIDLRWAVPLDGTELGALAGNWRGGSLRVLRRLVEGVWKARGGRYAYQ